MFPWLKYRRLARLFKTADVAQRTEIVEQGLAELRPADALRILGEAIMDGSPRVRHAAALALTEYDEPRAFDLLATAIPDEDLEIAHTATRALAARNWQPHRSIEKRRMHIVHLVQQLKPNGRRMSREAALALTQIDDPLASYEAPDAVVQHVAREATPQSIAFLTRAARSHGLIAGEILLAVRNILTTYARQIPESQLRELVTLEDADETETFREGTSAVLRSRVKKRISCEEIRRLARQELTRRAAEREKRKKYFCPSCSSPIPVKTSQFGRRIRCPECQQSHIAAEDNYC